MTSRSNFRYEWERVLRRARLTPSTKLVGFALGTYCNADGTSGRPSLERLVATTCTSRSTVIRGLGELRAVGLIERVFEGRKAGRRALADEYRLVIPDDLLDRVEMLPPDERPAAEQVADMTPDRATDQVPDVTPDPVSEQVADMTPDRAGTGVNSNPEQVSPHAEQVSPQPGSGVPDDTPPEQDQPETRSQHQELGSEGDHSLATPAVDAATTVLAQLSPAHQERLLDEARRRLGDTATGPELICHAADLHRRQRHNGAPGPTPQPAATAVAIHGPDDPPF